MRQLVYTHSDIDDLSNTSALVGSSSISFDDADSLEAKGGLLWEHGVGTGTTLQFGAYVTYEFLGETEVNFGNTEVVNDRGGLNGEIKFSAATVLDGGVTLFGEVKGRTELGSDDANSISGQVGARVPF
jgi:hypothetical protein